MVESEVTYLYSTHKEADSRMFFHLTNVSSPANAVVRTADTDCLIIALGCKRLYNPLLKIWLEVGLESKNTLRYITQLSENHFATHYWHIIHLQDVITLQGKVKSFKILEKCLMSN